MSEKLLNSPGLCLHVMAVLLLALSAGCSGSGGKEGPTSVFSYQTLDSRVPGTSLMRAIGFSRDGDGNVTSPHSVHGTMVRESQAIDIAGVIVDSDGKSNDRWTSGTTTVAPNRIAHFSGVYDYVAPFSVTSGGYTGTYLIGVAARHDRLPTSGTAIYSGQSTVTGILTGGGAGASAFSATGDLSLTADFQAGTVRVALNQLSGTGTPFDKLTLDGLAISNDQGDAVFGMGAAGSVTATNNGTAVTPIGTVSTKQVAGSFYGGDNQGPVEAGGSFNLTGPQGQLFGVFIADSRR